MKHNTYNYLLAPPHAITVALIGCGGTGTNVLTALAKIHISLRAMNHPGLYVFVFDPDEVTEANLGRQLFLESEMGVNKAISMTTRVNRHFGLYWKARPCSFLEYDQMANIYISCVDTAKARVDIANHIYRRPERNFNKDTETPYYWLDFGNSRTAGQAILGDIYDGQFPNVIQKFPGIKKVKEVDEGPSCSLAIALTKQDLFINSTLANLGMDLIWKLFSEGGLNYHGLFVNLDNFTVNPIPIFNDQNTQTKKKKRVSAR